MELGLKNKKALITGSSRGIGLAIAKAFLSEKADVLITSRKQQELNSLKSTLSDTYSATVLAKQCDFNKLEDIIELKKFVSEKWNKLDVLVLNVGSGKSVNDLVPEKNNFSRVLDHNFTSAVDTVREFYDLIKTAKGNIVFISSIAGLESIGAPVDYSVAKSALVSFSKNLARKAAKDEVRVNCVAPGNVFFPGGSWDEKIKADPDRIKNLIDAGVPMKRFGSPDEIADSVVFLSSLRASFITGSCLVVDGGQTVNIF